MPKLVTLALATIALAHTDAAAPKPPTHSSTQLTITSLETAVVLIAQSNPKELHVEKHAPWLEAKNSWSDRPALGYTGGGGRTMTFELLFDTYEARTNAHTLYVEKLTSLAMQIDPNGAEDKKRPPKVKVEWGSSGIKLEGVVDSVDCKYTMFLPDSTPVKASCVVRVVEAGALSVKK